MKHGSPAALRLALLLSIGLFALNSQQWSATGLLLLLWFLGLTRLRVVADQMLQFALALIAAGAAWLLSTVIALPVDTRTVDVLGPIGQLVSLTLLLVTVSRSFFTQPWGGTRASASLTLLALLFLADGQFGVSFIALSVVILVCLWRALWAADPARTGWGAMDRRLRARTVVTCTIAGVVAAGTSLAVPAVYPWLSSIALNAIDHPEVSTGFSTTLALGSLSDLHDNDARILRVYGRYVEHLRGIAYDEYRFGRWVQSSDDHLRPVRLEPIDMAFTTEIETVGGDPERYFVPLEAVSVSVPGNAARVDDGGDLHVAPSGRADRVRFRSGARTQLAPAPPRARDLELPEAVAPQLRKLANEWTAGATGPAARIAALADHLRSHYDYALEFERTKGVDPVLDFLTIHRMGHCEYFASALALLARSIGIPARVIGGYRVAEHNDLGDYYVVREQHAHAWVEAWQPGSGWQTYDATPASALPGEGAHTPLLAEVFDYAGHLVSSLTRSITTRGLYATAAGLFVAWIVLRIVQRFRGRTARAADHGHDAVTPPALAKLLHALERQGLPRDAHEPLERYADRLNAGPRLSESAAALRSYSALRYGGHGVAHQVEGELQRAAKSLAKGVGKV